MTPDLHTLVGPYVVDALPDDERAQFEEHLRRCAECQAEVAGLQATARRGPGAGRGMVVAGEVVPAALVEPGRDDA